MGRSSELLAFSDVILCSRSLVTVAVLVAGSGLPVGSPPYILPYPGITPVRKGGATGPYSDCRTALQDTKMAAVTHLGYTVI